MQVKTSGQDHLEGRFKGLRETRDRDPRTAALGRSRFLGEASRLRLELRESRHGGARLVWRLSFVPLVVLAVLFVAGLGVARASQDALPGEMLYSVKLLGEDIRLGTSDDVQEQLDLLMSFINVRAVEMERLTYRGLPVPLASLERMQFHLQQALVLAAGQDDSGLQMALQRIGEALNEQLMEMENLDGNGEGVISQTRLMLQEQIMLVEQGLQDPTGFREKVQWGWEESSPELRLGSPEIPTGGGASGSGTPDGPGQSPGPRKTPEGTGQGGGAGSSSPPHGP